jgi:mono/diheme cytochrome c family protein
MQCHGDLPNSTIIGINNVDKITNAIAADLGGMGAMGGLTPDQISAINGAIPTQAQAPVLGATPGETLYSQKCAACHKQLASSPKAGASLATIQNGIATVPNMASLKSLTTAQLTDIASALATVTPPTPTPGALPGQTLYVNYCESCHTPFVNSDRAGATVARINGAIAANTGSMSSLNKLTAAQITDIAAALATVTTPTPAATTGETLYRTYCSACHGAFATSSKAGATVSRINTAVAANTGGMAFVSTSLTPAQLLDIETALGTLTVPVIMDGATLYATNCSGCHNPLADSTKKGLTLARFNAATANNSVTSMGYLASLLSVDQVNAIIGVMPPLPVDGAGLYTTNCASCHGPLSASAKAGPTMTVGRIQAGITANAGMAGSVASLTVSQLTLIANTLAALSAPVLNGADLYAANCASCHNPLTTSAKAGPSMTVARIQAGIAANAGMAGFATSLTVSQLTLISNELAALPAPVLDGPGLYSANCASCHNPLATSTKGGASAAKIQKEITNKRGSVAGVGGMGAANLVALTPAQLVLIEQALAPIAPPACGSCHVVSLATITGSGHNTHNSKPKTLLLAMFKSTAGCEVCHGTGYTIPNPATSTVRPTALTHNDGNRTVNASTTGVAAANPPMVDASIVWVPPVRNATTGAITTKGTCSPQCHSPAGAKRSW